MLSCVKRNIWQQKEESVRWWTDRDASIHQRVWVQCRRQLMKKVRRLLEQLRRRPLHHVLQHLRLAARNSVPRLRLTPTGTH